MIQTWQRLTPDILSFITSDGNPIKLAKRLVPNASLKDQWKAVVCIFIVNTLSRQCPIGYYTLSGFIQFSTNTPLENNFELAEYLWTAFEDYELEATTLALLTSQVDKVTPEIVYLSEILERWSNL